MTTTHMAIAFWVLAALIAAGCSIAYAAEQRLDQQLDAYHKDPS